MILAVSHSGYWVGLEIHCAIARTGSNPVTVETFMLVWCSRLAHRAYNTKVGGSSPPSSNNYKISKYKI